jgi:dihydropteroate synthase
MRRQIGTRAFDFSRQVAVMAIINRTPDSFFDRGSTFELHRAVAAALAAVRDGADIVDVGGVPFGRGPAISVDEELDRVVPLIEAIRAASDVVISVDTHRAEVARLCLEAGADIVNDTSGLYDRGMAAVVAGSTATLVLTHSLAPPRSEPPRAHYDDVTADVVAFLRDRIARAVAAGSSSIPGTTSTRTPVIRWSSPGASTRSSRLGCRRWSRFQTRISSARPWIGHGTTG